VADVTLRAAHPDEAPALSDLALRSKAHWDYSDEFIAASRDELTVRPAQIEARQVTVAEIDGAVAGFSVVTGTPPLGEVDKLFVAPEQIGAGVGVALFAALRSAAVDAGFSRLRIESDPNAVGFYERQGAVVVGDTPSVSIPGRTLPLLELDLTGTS
jgi:GNAT superfamily N-acetyltransferase